MNRIFSFLIVMAVTIVANAEGVTFDDVMNYRFYPKQIGAMKALSDGMSYSAVSHDGRRIERFSFANGERQDVLLDLDNARGSAAISSIEDYIVSPDERNILVATNVSPIYRRSFTANYYIYNVKNRTFAPLSKNGAQECPKFSPDGTMVAFVRENNLFLVKLLFNNAESQVTKDGERNKIINGKPDWVYEEEFSYSCAYDFSADSEMLAWVRFDESEVKTFSFPWYQGASPSLSEYALYPGAYEYKYPKAGEKNSKVSVLSFDIKSRVTRTMQVPLDADGYIPRIQFSGQKDMLMVVTLNRHQDRMDVYSVNARSTSASLVLREKNSKYIDEITWDNLDFSKNQFVLVSERDGFAHMYLYTIGGQLLKQLTSGNFEVLEYYGCDAAGKNFYFASNEGSPLEKYIYKVDASGKRVKLNDNTGTNNALFSANCQYFINSFSDLNTPNVVTLCNNSGKRLKVVEDNAEVKSLWASREKGEQSLFKFKTADGVELNGWMVKPVDFNPSKRYPVLMYQYSGPNSQQVKNAFSNGSRSSLAWEHYIADKGCIVVCVDGRGTGGRGSDFKRCTYMRLGELESHDQVETAVYLGSLPYVDKERIAIWGWSFGGFNTLMSMSEGRNVFRCGVAVAPVTDWRYYDTVYTERFMRTPQENPSGYDISPMQRHRKLSGKLLIVHGTADDNVHYQNTAEYTEQLVQADIPFEMQVYTNRNHSIRGGNTSRHLFSRIEAFLSANLLR